MNQKIELFESTASYPEKGLVMIFDLEGFSKFFAQPDVQDYVPKYLNHIIDAVRICIEGGNSYWIPNVKYVSPLPKPIHWKFLGDGLLIIWKFNDFTDTKLKLLFNRFWILKNSFNKINTKTSNDVPVVDIPQRIRFGLASGNIFKLNYQITKDEEYIGYSINLASRLQSYCRELGFIASARINPSKETLNESSYIKVIASKIKGFPKEIVIVDKDEYNNLPEDIRNDLFEEIK